MKGKGRFCRVFDHCLWENHQLGPVHLSKNLYWHFMFVFTVAEYCSYMCNTVQEEMFLASNVLILKPLTFTVNYCLPRDNAGIDSWPTNILI